MSLKIQMVYPDLASVEITQRVGGLPNLNFSIKVGHLFPINYYCRVFIPSLEWMHTVTQGSVVLSWLGDFVIANQVIHHPQGINPGPERMTVHYSMRKLPRDLEVTYTQGKILTTNWVHSLFWGDELNLVENKIQQLMKGKL